ncbi:metal-dependent hydrolase [Sphingomonas oleivorans]|uniref:Metal-dependent hydrolase n=1 Tax=Sphingomonas oleivorans TaxID=1735121 RepID=A0A2T5G396_9SPHN|nr:SprT family zinc-dependent metalloprotease [Sphingomonas oleivorans]PTQ13614.1 metal-dependent hydrolase [Sphingomonas oleivorans]
MAQARRIRLSVDPRDGGVRLILPKRAALRQAFLWVEGQRGWIEAALEALPRPQPILPGGTIPFMGSPLLIDWDAVHPRAVVHQEERLRLGGPRESVAPRVLRWLRARAAAVLEEETRLFGTRAGVSIGRVAVGDPRARWGSCSASGDIRYSWRLILAPPDVREATVAHEVAHRLHMDHSPDFHAAVRRLLGRDPDAERRWLRTHGPGLYWLGRDP